MQTPTTDDFRLEREDEALVATFTPEGRTYRFTLTDGTLSEPDIAPARLDTGRYDAAQVRQVACDLAKRALGSRP